jgi:hypothetical protein
MDDYRLFVNEDRTVLVTLWVGQGPDGSDLMDIAVREHPDAIWGPPTQLEEEK